MKKVFLTILASTLIGIGTVNSSEINNQYRRLESKLFLEKSIISKNGNNKTFKKFSNFIDGYYGIIDRKPFSKKLGVEDSFFIEIKGANGLICKYLDLSLNGFSSKSDKVICNTNVLNSSGINANTFPQLNHFYNSYLNILEYGMPISNSRLKIR